MWLTPSWVKSSSDKLIISSLEERWLTEREAVNQQLLAERKAEKNRSPAKKRPRGFLLNKAPRISPSAWSTLPFIYLFCTLLMCTRPIYKNKREKSERRRVAFIDQSCWGILMHMNKFPFHEIIDIRSRLSCFTLLCFEQHGCREHTIIFASSQGRI